MTETHLFISKDAAIRHIEKYCNKFYFPDFYRRALDAVNRIVEPTGPMPYENIDAEGQTMPGQWIIRWKWTKFNHASDSAIMHTDSFTMEFIWLRT